MIVLVPVSRFWVKYEIVQGRPYSRLDQLILKSVGNGASSLEELKNTFHIHLRLLTQSLVTLIHAGWIALGIKENESFIITQQGKFALNLKELPPFLEVEKRQAYFLLEQITGTVIPEEEVQYVSKKRLSDKGLWEKCVSIKAQVFHNRLDESEIFHMLPKDQNQRLHIVESITMVSKGDHYIPIDIDIHKGNATNIPDRCKAILLPYVLDKAKQENNNKIETNPETITWNDFDISVDKGRFGGNPTPRPVPTSVWFSQYSSSDLLVTTEDHIRVFYQVLGSAKTSILVLTSEIDLSSLERFKQEIQATLMRGVNIDILWKQGGKTVVDWFKKFNYDNRDLTGKIRFNKEPSRSNGKLLIWDDEGDNFLGVIGNFNWLSIAPQLNEARDLYFSLKIKHPAIVSRLARSAAGFWAECFSEITSAAPNKWRKVSEFLDSKVVEGDIPDEIDFENFISIKVVINREHAVLFKEQANAAQGQFVIGSNTLLIDNREELNSIFDQLKSRELISEVLYNVEAVNNGSTGVGGIFENTSLINLAGLKTNFMISDSLTCISSYNFLSPTIPSSAFPRELGVVIDGGNFAEQILTLIRTKQTDIRESN